MGTEVIAEEAFMDAFCDLMYGGGWMEIEQEEVDRECNWALMRATVYILRDHHLNVLCPYSQSPSSRRARPTHIFDIAADASRSAWTRIRQDGFGGLRPQVPYRPWSSLMATDMSLHL